MLEPDYVSHLRQLGKAFAALTPKERAIIALRYGLKDGKYKTLDKVGKHFTITRERVRQIEESALEKIRIMYFAFHNE